MKGSTIGCLLVILYAALAVAEPLPPKQVPEPLKPWIDWVLHGETDEDCPLIYNRLSEKVCTWPSQLKIDFESTRARFSQKWEVYAKEKWVELPGQTNFWPAQVQVNGKPWLVGVKNGMPVIFAEKPGTYTVTGEFQYTRRPEWIQIPGKSGLVDLSIEGRAIMFPRLDADGKLWLKHGQNEMDEQSRENRCDVTVHRLIRDTIPLRIVTHLDLYISGKQRTIDIGNIGLQDFIPVEIESRLPVKIEPKGQLIIQAKPGKWNIRFILRHKSHPEALSQSDVGNFNTRQEIWSFEPHHYLRMVDIIGPVQINPQQTTMPDEWKTFPAYLLKPDTTLKFVEKKRGDPQPTPDKLNLKRLLWLDFDGTGFSVRDHITGKMTTGWRLSIDRPIFPGRIMLNGKEQFITKLDESGKAGIEMRFGNVNMTAESRIEKTGEIPVAGWDRDFNSVAGELHLPPGWSLFDASGIDNIKATWLKAWTLLDLFLVLIISLGVFKLISYRWGAVSLITLVLLQHETGAPCWVWLNILAAVALLKVVPKGKIYSLINNYRLFCLACLILISLPFMVNQIRYGIYPQLEYARRAMDSSAHRYAQTEEGDAFKNAPAQTALPRQQLFGKSKSDGKMDLEQDAVGSWNVSQRKAKYLDVSQFYSNAKIQTGAGMPTWQWNKILFSWNGPVKTDETMKFVFLSPGVNMVLGFVRVILLGLLIYGIAGIKLSIAKGVDFSNIKPSALISAVFIFVCFLPVTQANAESSFPSEEMLKQLKSKLIEKEKPDCEPQCAVIPRAKIVIDKNRLKMAMEIHSLYKNIALPLPGSAKHWLATTVLLNGNPVSSLYRDPTTGYIWVRVAKGIQNIHIEGGLPSRRTVQIPFPMNINHMDVDMDGWSVEGVHENGVIDSQLQFTRINTEKKKKESFESDLLPRFLEITRIFHLGLTWKIETVVKRTTPLGVAVVQQIPLLQGESVTTDIPVENGNILLNMGPGQQETRWVSNLEISNPLNLKAAETLDYIEVWKLNISTIWHSDIKGIPVIHHQDQQGRWFPEFRPWPGEALSIHISRPKGIQGQTYTVEKSALKLDPGQRITNADLELIVRSSRGSRHIVKLPPQSKLHGLLINGKSQPITQADEKVVLPLVPGEQNIHLAWRTTKDIGFKWKASKVDVGIPSVDSYVTVKMPQNRWILFCSGPYVGPAVLFWSTVIVMFLLSLILGKIKLTPLKHYHWFLLGLGLTQVSILTVLPVAIWLIALGLRGKNGKRLSDARFNLIQLFLPVLSLIAVLVLFNGIHNGLLGYPDMQIAGNGSHDHLLKWYKDISGNSLPQPIVFSLPMTVYRILILAWALWIAFALIKWLRWGWECYSADGLWRKIDIKRLRKNKKDNAAPNQTETIDDQTH